MATYTYSGNHAAHSTDGGLVTIPDQVFAAQKDHDGERIPVLDRMGEARTAILRGDLYGLHTPGTGDPVVELIED
jgi:hypothetical protein